MNRNRGSAPRVSAAVLFLLIGLAGSAPITAIELPVGFVDNVAVADVLQAIDFDWDPDGGMWIAGKQGQIWVVRQTTTLAAQLTVEDSGDAGLVSVVVDPDYANNQYIWVYYLTPEPLTNRLSRFTNSNDTLINETVILEFGSASVGYNGGCVEFLPDGTILVGMGMNGGPDSAQDPYSLRGKMLRINQDGSVPPDNPFSDGIDGDPLVWAYGLRNPWRCSLQPGTDLMFIGDVGWHDWEEINIGGPEANFGFPLIEGPGQPAGTTVTEPFYAFPHMPLPEHHAVIAGDFAEAGEFPTEYVGDYFFADHNQQKILRMRLDSFNNIVSVEDFATNAQYPVTMKFGPGGAMYYAAWFENSIRKIEFVGETGAGGRVPLLRIYVYEVLGGQITLVWQPSCNAGDTDFAIFSGTIPDFDVVNALVCSTNGAMARSIWPDAGNVFYLVAPHNQFWGGSFGLDGDGNEREPTGTLCYTPSPTPCN